MNEEGFRSLVDSIHQPFTPYLSPLTFHERGFVHGTSSFHRMMASAGRPGVNR